MTILPQVPPPNSARWALYAHHLGDYMHRWILRTPWGTLRLHHILRSDADRHLHDHPFDFTSFLLTGGYTEVTFRDPPVPGTLDHAVASAIYAVIKEPLKQEKKWPRFSVVRKKAEDAHALRLNAPLWTFVISGPKRRSWGFHTEKGWVHHADYENVLAPSTTMLHGEDRR